MIVIQGFHLNFYSSSCSSTRSVSGSFIFFSLCLPCFSWYASPFSELSFVIFCYISTQHYYSYLLVPLQSLLFISFYYHKIYISILFALYCYFYFAISLLFFFIIFIFLTIVFYYIIVSCHNSVPIYTCPKVFMYLKFWTFIWTKFTKN